MVSVAKSSRNREKFLVNFSARIGKHLNKGLFRREEFLRGFAKAHRVTVDPHPARH
jgi:hypothetical protein